MGDNDDVGAKCCTSQHRKCILYGVLSVSVNRSRIELASFSRSNGKWFTKIVGGVSKKCEGVENENDVLSPLTRNSIVNVIIFPSLEHPKSIRECFWLSVDDASDGGGFSKVTKGSKLDIIDPFWAVSEDELLEHIKSVVVVENS